MQRGIVQTVAQRPLVSGDIVPRTGRLSTQFVYEDARAGGQTGKGRAPPGARQLRRGDSEDSK